MSPLTASNVDSQGITYSLNGDDFCEYNYTTPKDFGNWTGVSLRIIHLATGGWLDSVGYATGPAYICTPSGSAADWHHWEIDKFGRIVLRYNTNLCLYKDNQIVDWRNLNVNDNWQYWILKDSEIISKEPGPYYLYANQIDINGCETHVSTTAPFNLRQWKLERTDNESYSSYVGLSSEAKIPATILPTGAYILNPFYRSSFRHGLDIGDFKYYVGDVFKLSNQYNGKRLDSSKHNEGKLCQWGDAREQLWTINNDGILESVDYPGWCIYYGSSSDAEMRPISAVYGNWHVWRFNPPYIYSAMQPSYVLATPTSILATNGSSIRITNISGSSSQQWNIINASSHYQYKTKTFKRGVMDTHGKIHKIVGIVGCSNRNFTPFHFQYHKSSEISGTSPGRITFKSG